MGSSDVGGLVVGPGPGPHITFLQDRMGGVGNQFRASAGCRLQSVSSQFDVFAFQFFMRLQIAFLHVEK